MNVSVITPVRDDPNLSYAMASVPPGVEYVVALTLAPDFIKRLVYEYQRRQRPDMVVREVTQAGMAAGVNAATETTSHEKVIVLDSDCTLTMDTVRAYDRALDRADFIRGVTKVRREGFWSSFSGLGQAALNQKYSREKPRLIGPSIAYRKAPFLALGGYDVNSGGSCDHEFALRLEDANLEVAFEPEAVIQHAAITLQVDLRSHLGYGRSMCYIDAKRGGRYGLGVCLDRWAPRTLCQKTTQRGVTSLFRSLLLGGYMLAGYAQHMASDRKKT